MKKLNKLTAILLSSILLLLLLPSLSAVGISFVEVYKVIYGTDGMCTIEGRVYSGADGTASLTASGVSMETTTASDGSFSFEFEYDTNDRAFEIKTDGGAGFESSEDISDIPELLSLCDAEAVMFNREGVYLFGVNAEPGELVTLTLANKENHLDFKGFVQTKADDDGKYTLGFKAAEGEYRVAVKLADADAVSCNAYIPDMTDSLSVCEDNTAEFINKLNEKINKAESLISQCRGKQIPTVYEEAQLAVVQAFIDNIGFEAEYGDMSRMGQYNYELTNICDTTIEALEKYLNREKTAFDVPRYVTSGITKDGTSLVATVKDLSGERRQPTFFTGLMSIDNVCGDMIPQFSKMGFNATQVTVNPMRFIANYNPHILDGWYHFEIGDVGSTAEITSEEACEGTKSFKIVNPDKYNYDNYRRFTNYVKVKPNTEYTWGFSAKGKNINNTWFNPDNRIGKGYKYISASEDWKKYLYKYTTGENQTVMELTFGCEDVCDAVYIDDVFVYESGNDENLVTNGSFEDDTPREKSELDTEMAERGWYINYFGLDWLKETLRIAEENSFMVDVLVPIDLMPSFVRESDPTMLESVSQFIPFATDNETAREYVRWVAITIAETVKDFKSVNSICLNNEPWLDTNNNSRFNEEVTGHYDKAWQDYLREIYDNSIIKLNSNYGRVYDSFDEVKMPTTIDSSAIYTDYRGFNDKLLNDFFTWYEAEIRPYVGDMNVHIKIMDYFRYNYKDPYVEGGTNWELLQDKFDINGCDAHSYFGDLNTPLELKMGWYDFMTSVKDAPVYDTESHIVHDGRNIEYKDIINDYYEADIWNGAVHGRAVDVIWNYDTEPARSALGDSVYSNANMAHKPMALSAVARTSLDLQRLAGEITALQNEKAKVGLLYSWANLTINENHMTEVAAAYRDIIFSGQKAEIVTDSDSQNISGYDLLVVPDVIYADSDMLESIRNYIQSGGKVLLLGDNSFTCNKYGKQERTSGVAEFIRQNSDTGMTVRDKIKEMNLSEIKVVDADTGESTDDIEWSYARYGDKYVINILNYDNSESKRIKLLLGAAEITNVTELRSGLEAEDGVLTAEPYKPMLAAIGQFGFDILDESGAVIKENTDELESGVIRCNVRTEGGIIMALYKDDVLVDISVGADTMKVDVSDGGNYRLMATVWDMQTMSPKAAKRYICTR